MNLPHKNSKLLLIKILIVIEIIKMILTIIAILIIITKIITTIIIKYRGRYRTPTRTNTELLVTLYNGRRPLSNIKKSFPSDAVRVLYVPLKRLIQNLTWWIGVEHAPWVPCLELSPTWFLKNNCNGNVNQNSDYNNYYNNHNSDSKTIIRIVII